MIKIKRSERYCLPTDDESCRTILGFVSEQLNVEHFNLENCIDSLKNVVNLVIENNHNSCKSESKITSVKFSGKVQIEYVRTETEQELKTRLNKIERFNRLPTEKSELIKKLKQHEKEIENLKTQIKELK